MTPALGAGRLAGAGRRHKLSHPTNHGTPRNSPRWGKWYWTNIPDTLARGEILDPRIMFESDLLRLLCRWKALGAEIILMVNFNKNVYMGVLAASLAKDELCLSKNVL
jgi:hypothetical protein